MQIWVDADACPNVIKDILFRAADRNQVILTLVANQFIKYPPSLYIKMLQVSSGFDVADNEIIKRISKNDLVITSDIPLAADVLHKEAYAISPRGKAFLKETIKEQLTMRDFMDTLRSSGIQTGGPNALIVKERQYFSSELDKWLNLYNKQLKSTN